MLLRQCAATLGACLFTVASIQGRTPIQVGPVFAETRAFYGMAHGLPSEDISEVAITADDTVYAASAKGLTVLKGERWSAIPKTLGKQVERITADGNAVLFVLEGKLYRLHQATASMLATIPVEAGKVNAVNSDSGVVLLATETGLYKWKNRKLSRIQELQDLLGKQPAIRQTAVSPDKEVAVAAAAGLFVRDPSGKWARVFPKDHARSWAPVDIRGVAYDTHGRLWFASPQGVGCRDQGTWKLYTPDDGLPYDDFTSVSTNGNEVWFGTKIGAIRFDGKTWEYREGLRWLPDDAVRSVAVGRRGDAWLATSKGIGVIKRTRSTLAEKARLFEDEIDKRHRRTPYGYVLEVSANRPGDKSEWTQHDSDNDGLWTSMYGAGECFAYGATRDPLAKKRAKAAFEALRFLGEVTQGGEHPAPKGFVARSILPTDGRDPNLHDSKEHDEQMRATRDSRWKTIEPRWPKSADGRWYWKSDTSSDELDGHYFFYGVYYDLVADTEAERSRVREHVAALTDHLIDHKFHLVDHDGKPARWGYFSPESLNHDYLWWEERALNSLSILTYLKTAEHITGNARYGEAARKLIDQHSYAMNVMIWKPTLGAGGGNQSDDEMAFMCFYNLMRYEKDSTLRKMYALALRRYWELEKYELNPLFDFISATTLDGVMYVDDHDKMDLSISTDELEGSIDTLVRFPLDRFNWRLQNSHRKDLVLLPQHLEEGGRGSRRDGRVLPIDERFVNHWNNDPWKLDQGGNGRQLADGAAYLLPYYMGLYHRFVQENERGK